MRVYDTCIEMLTLLSLSKGPLVISRARDLLYKCYDRETLTPTIFSTLSQVLERVF